MHYIISAGFLFLLAVLCLAQTPRSSEPKHDNMAFYPPPYDPPPMVLIPAGEYDMGDHSGIGLYDEIPVHKIYVDAFYMDTYEVTNHCFVIFLNYAKSRDKLIFDEVYHYVRRIKDNLPVCAYNDNQFNHIQWNNKKFTITPGKENHPAVAVTWYGAAMYANWRSAQEGLQACYDTIDEYWPCHFYLNGFRIPTEAEWENAARGGEYNPYFDYPWGNVIDGSMANYAFSGDPFEYEVVGTTPIGYYNGNQIPIGIDMANGFGLYDISGNTIEWCNDYYTEDYYQYCVDNNVYDNPKGPDAVHPLHGRVLRNGSWTQKAIDQRCANRHFTDPYHISPSVGFRLVRNVQ